MRRLLAAAAASLAAVLLAACSSAPASPAPPAAAPARTAAPAPACTQTPTFDYIERTTEPGLQASAVEIGNWDLVNCVDSLSNFQATAGQGDGECTTIALASKNPGYDPNAVPAAPLKDVIESAGPGC